MSVLIKSGYYIVFNPSKAIVFMYQIHFISISGPELEEQKLLILRKEIQLHVCLSGLTHEADQLKLQRCLRSQLKSSAEAAIILEQSRALQVHTVCLWIKMAKELATSNLPFQTFEGFIGTSIKNNFSNLVRAFLENPLFVLFPA